MTEALNGVTDGFMIDTQHPDNLRESIRNANFAAQPLHAVDFSLLPHSDDSIIFNLTQPRADEGDDDDEEEETPPPSDFSGNSEVVMPSSPPCLPDYESSPQSPLPTAHSPPNALPLTTPRTISRVYTRSHKKGKRGNRGHDQEGKRPRI
ncbi:hypothetical protein BFJ69_g17125 [Fusarium oxysporum]|uniref:Uncharacterized protein n=1 Tax=Fusarium oxysporum TaxID=5507 RepID=A0A420M966_FUSOX|nr:hypothetical protein BFJ69_g17125 [Fusarium oxysporum]